MDSSNASDASLSRAHNGSNPVNQNPFGSFFGSDQGAAVAAPAAVKQHQQIQDPWASPTSSAPAAEIVYSSGPSLSPASSGIQTQQQPSSMAFNQNPYFPQGGVPVQSQQPQYQQQSASQHQQQTQSQQPLSQYQQPQPYQQQPQSPYRQQTQGMSSGSNPFETAHSSLVVSHYQSNPYAQQLPVQNTAVVVSQYQSNPYANLISDPNDARAYNGGFQQQQYPVGGGTSGQSRSNPFDPFAAAPAPLPVPASNPFGPPAPASYPFGAPASDPFGAPAPASDLFAAQTSTSQQIQQPFDYNRPKAFSAESEPYMTQSSPQMSDRRNSFDANLRAPPVQESDEHQTIETQQHQQSKESTQTSIAIVEHQTQKRQVDAPKAEDIPTTFHTPSYDYGHRADVPPDPDIREGESPRNKYSLELARRAPPGSRTIVMKKWKQSYWVQYGPHTMLWFRSQGDFDDWLNNPYHSQAERNFLIKLAVNFVHDLYKPNVRGYQVTQCRTKGYGNKLVRQFKLERWMDYGPTIAAAFGSYNPKEVDDLREAIVDCMRNTPLDGGIRATGAVRQRPQQENVQQRQRSESQDSSSHEAESRVSPSREAQHQTGGYRRESYDNLPSEREDKEPQPATDAAKEVDLMDVNNWDDPAQPATGHPNMNGALVPTNDSYGQQPPYQGQQQYQPQSHQPLVNQQQDQPQQLPSSGYYNAMVHSTQPLAYPGAPPITQQQNPYQQQPQQAFQTGYSNAIVPTTIPTQSYSGAPPLPQQQYAAQAGGGWNQPVPQQQQLWNQPQPPQQQQQQTPW